MAAQCSFIWRLTQARPAFDSYQVALALFAEGGGDGSLSLDFTEDDLFSLQGKA
jgi:hypothetical protein